MYRFISILYIAFLGAVSCFAPSSTTTILAQPRQYHHLANSLKLNNDSSGGLLQSRLYMSDAAGSYLDSLSAKGNEIGEEVKVCKRSIHKIVHTLFICMSHSRCLHLFTNHNIDWQNIYMVNTPTRSYKIYINITKLSLCLHPTKI